jgi:hypothetical protein
MRPLRLVLWVSSIASLAVCVMFLVLWAMSARTGRACGWAAGARGESGSAGRTLVRYFAVAVVDRGVRVFWEAGRSIPAVEPPPVPPGLSRFAEPVTAPSGFDFSVITSHTGEASAPLWAAVLVTALLPAWTASRVVRRPAPGLCPSCGYDLRESPAGCPECGVGRTMA